MQQVILQHLPFFYKSCPAFLFFKSKALLLKNKKEGKQSFFIKKKRANISLGECLFFFK
jgi:hypothetical protein